MSCDQFQDRLSEFLDGELPREERNLFEEHVTGCEKCRENIEFFRDAEDMARGIEVPDPGTEYWSSFSGRVRTRIRKGKSAKAGLMFLFRIGGAVAVAAAVVIVVVFALNTTEPPAISEEAAPVVVDPAYACEVALARTRDSVLPVLNTSEMFLTRMLNMDTNNADDLVALKTGLRRAGVLENIAMVREVNYNNTEIDRFLNGIEVIVNRIENIVPADGAGEVLAVQNAVIAGGMLDEAFLIREKLTGNILMTNTGIRMKSNEMK